MAVVSIIAAIAYPSYQDSIEKSRRSEAQAALMGLSSSMARWYAQNNSSYTGAATANANTGAPQFYSATVPADGNDVYYNLSITAANATSYTLRATPTGKQAGDGYMEVTSDGIKRWDADNSGSIGTGENEW